jgi:hypothetical protein
MIHPDGTVEIESPRMSITRGTTREDFVASSLFAISRPLNQNAPWSRYSFQPVEAGGENFECDICFCAGTIYSLIVSSLRPEFGDSWSNSSVEQEQAKHCFHKQLLQSILRRSPDEHIPRGLDERDADIGYDFPWGKVSATTDTKAGGCFIFINYAAQTLRLGE